MLRLRFLFPGKLSSHRGIATLQTGAKRRHICDLHVKKANRTVQICVPALEDEKPIHHFLNDVLVNNEPGSLSVGVSYDDMSPVTEGFAERGVRSGLTTIAVDGNKLVGVSAAFVAERDHEKKPLPAKDTAEFGELIDSMESELPSRKARRVLAPMVYLEEIVWNFIPAEVQRLMRVELSCVDNDYQDGGILRQLVMHQARLALEQNLKYFDCQVTAAKTTGLMLNMGAESPFHIKYSQMMDKGEPIHKKFPMPTGVDRISLIFAPIAIAAYSTKAQ